MVTRFRFWSLAQWFTMLTVLVVSVVAAIVLVQLSRDESWLEAAKTGAPIGGVLVAVLSLVATSVSLTANWRRQRRHETLKAWSDWSDKSFDARRNVTMHLGMSAISETIGRAMADNQPAWEDGVDLTDVETRRQVTQDVVTILNGLERIAIGIDLGVYDLETLRRVGGTIVVREWERGQMYIAARRSATDERRRQKKVFVWLESLANQLQRQKLREAGRDLDRNRIMILRRNR